MRCTVPGAEAEGATSSVPEARRDGARSRSVHLETHPVVDFIVCERDVVLVDCVPARRDHELATLR